MIIGLDFDGTLVTHTYPEIGKDIGAFQWLKRAQALSVPVGFILVTMRDGAELKAARAHVEAQGVELIAANTNPTQWRWTMSPKPYCHLYVDDAALGVPLKHLPGEHRPCVDWDVAGPAMMEAIQAWHARTSHPEAEEK